MKVLFCNPPWFEGEPTADPKRFALRAGVRAGSRWPHTNYATSEPGNFQFGKYLPFPFFMAYATSYAAAHTDAEITFRDSIALHETYETFYNSLRILHPDVVFVESASPSWMHDAALIRDINRILPKAKIAVCGTVVSVKAKEILETLPVAACLKGEYEKNAVKVIEGATGILEHDLLSAEEMNRAPFPFFAPETATNYADACPAGVQFPHAQVWASRGCFHKCIFCEWPATMTGNDPDGLHKRTVRFYSADYVRAFLSEIKARFGFKSIYFDDDTFNLNDRHTAQICEVMREIGLPWAAMTRADTSSREVWRLMKESGCYGVKIGFESGSDRVVNKIIGKKLDLEAAVETGRFLTSIGINWHGTFTVGLPGETLEEQKMTHALIVRCYAAGMSTHQLSGTAVADGTPLDTLRTAGRLEAYPDAVIDSNYREEKDGAKKIQSLNDK